MGCCCSTVEPEDSHEEYTKKQVGPMQQRSCHDLLFLALFVGFWIGMFYIAGVAVKNGNPNRLIYGVDYLGNVCGENNIQRGQIPANYSLDLTDYQYLYFLESKSDTRGYIDICVRACPNATYDIPTNDNEVLCPYDVNASSLSYPINPTEGPCFGTFASTPVIHRCVPIVLEELLNYTENAAATAVSAFNLAYAADYSIKIFGSLIRAWQYIAVSGAGALVLSFVWLLLMSRLAGVVVYLTILAVHAVLIVMAYFVYHELQTLQNDYSDTPEYLRLMNQNDTIKTLEAIFIILIIVLAVIFLGVIVLWSRIGIAIGIIKEASKAMIHIPTILLVPFGVGISMIPLIIYWFWIGAYLGTSGSPSYSDGQFTGYDSSTALIRMQIYHLIGGLWALNFLHAVGETVIAGAIASWYWVHDKHDVPTFPVATALYRVIRYHMGSLMFGSLILAIVQAIRIILTFLERQVKGKEQKLVKWVLRIVQCLLAFFERFIKFLNKNAYIMISIYGYSFCAGARRGFSLIAGNILRVTAVNCVTAFVIFLGKLFVCILTTLIAFLVMRNEYSNIGDYALPTIMIALLSYAISVAFFGVFDMAVDTLLLCFCEDCERNNGADRPYFMSDNLKSHIETEHKACCCCCL